MDKIKHTESNFFSKEKVKANKIINIPLLSLVNKNGKFFKKETQLNSAQIKSAPKRLKTTSDYVLIKIIINNNYKHKIHRQKQRNKNVC